MTYTPLTDAQANDAFTFYKAQRLTKHVHKMNAEQVKRGGIAMCWVCLDLVEVVAK